MCKAFSCIATRKKVYWKLGLDSHNDIKEHFKLNDSGEPFVPIEITPENNDYIFAKKWNFSFDDGVECPEWWKQSNDKMCFEALEEWKTQLYKLVYKDRIKNMINPFKVIEVKQVTKTDINNLRNWDSVRASVRDSFRDSFWDSVRASVRYSVWDSVWDSVWASFRDSVWDSVRYSVWDSVWDSVWAYTGYMFKINRKDWKYTENIKTKGYPFMPLIKLWKRGLVPSFDGEVWRLHTGKKAKIIFEISKKELMKTK